MAGYSTFSLETETLAAIDPFVRSEMQTLHIPGLAIGIVVGDRPVYLRGYGIADQNQRQVTPQTPFFINSLSKSFTAIAVMQLVEAGKLNLDETLQHYLPWFRTKNLQASAQITIRDLLYHTSGFPTIRGVETFYNGDSSDRALEQNVRRLRNTALSRPVGEKFQYSNINYDILGLLVQTISGQSFEKYMQRQILKPLEMRRSFLLPKSAKGLAKGYLSFLGLKIPYPITHSRSVRPSAGLISTAKDMTHILIAHLNDGRYKNAELLSPEGMANLYHPGVEVPGSAYGNFYAMGWYVTPNPHSHEVFNPNHHPFKAISHSGGSTGFRSYMCLMPERHFGVVVLMNTQDMLMATRYDYIGAGIMQILLGKLPTASQKPLTWLIRPFLLVIILLQVIRVFWAIQRLNVWKWQLKKQAISPQRIIGHSIFALVIDGVVLYCVFVVPYHFEFIIPHLPIDTLLIYLIRTIRAVPDIIIPGLLLMILTMGWGSIRTILAVKACTQVVYMRKTKTVIKI
jgi:CubicO group peptidase (beta-lactamase class C family)